MVVEALCTTTTMTADQPVSLVVTIHQAAVVVIAAAATNQA
ncbi:hypothetical protein AB6D66_01235 [Vibrio pomeroyi]|uniref:Uncharacterized protein n=1 Tax=Vibrio pomeroyi TaxID=198832 RepID=A0ABV4MRB5_9VIBR|nr:hypothetical protein [Vibrio atlanticus]MCZ4310252.1 hypothetical protein [Vibrio atlanticus]